MHYNLPRLVDQLEKIFVMLRAEGVRDDVGVTKHLKKLASACER